MYTDLQQPTVTASSAYTAGDAVGGKISFKVFGDSGFLYKLTLQDEDKNAVEYDLLLFNADFTHPGDGNAATVAAADMSKLVGVINVPSDSFHDFDSVHIATITTQVLPYNTPSIGGLFGMLVTRGTPTYTGTDHVIIKLTALNSGNN